MNFRSLRFKLVWTHGIIIALVLSGIGLVRYQTIAFRAQRSFNQLLDTDSRFFASRLEMTAEGFHWSTRDLNPSDALLLDELRHYFIVTDLDGRVLYPHLLSKYMQQMLARGELDEILKKRSGFSRSAAADGTIYGFASLPLAPGAVPARYTIHVGRSFEALTEFLREYRVMYISFIPLVMLISVLVGWIFAGRALRPFEEVSRTAEQITAQNLDTQVVSRHQEIEVQRLVQAFNAMVGRLHESFQQMRKFNADVAHDLRTPLAILQGENEIALRSPETPEEIRAVLASNLEELDRLKRMVNDMLTLAEAEAGHQILVKRPVNLKTILEDLVEQMRLLATDRLIQIKLLDLPDVFIDGDDLWIRRALLNLLDNAINYSNEGGTIRVRIAVKEDLVRLGIEDDGMGIAARDLPHIFDRLYRADPARTRSSRGTGLGLTLVKWIVEAHQGHIQVTSQIGSGSNFEITFPVSKAPPAVH